MANGDKGVTQDTTTSGTTNIVSSGTYMIGSDGNVSSSEGVDPSVNNWEASDDPLEIKNCIPVSSSKVAENADLITTSTMDWYDPKKDTDLKTQNHSTTKHISASKKIKAAVKQQNQNKYPEVLAEKKNSSGKTINYVYDYTLNVQKAMIKSIKEIKKDLNIPSAYTRRQLNELFHTQFNRFRIQYPDYFLNGTMAYVVMTRPDLNLFADDTKSQSLSNIHEQVMNDPTMYYAANANFETFRTLTMGYTSRHHFNPILSNILTSLDISDETIDLLETGETFTGFKTQYAKSNIRSMTAGTINLKFPETYNMAATYAHQIWCGYESSVYRGSMLPKDKYIWNRELDYACDIYYFLLDKEDMIIRYWCKYTGCFPLNVNKSIYSYDAGSEINHPELSVTYSYFAREDLSALVLNEFNNNSGGRTNGFKYKANYIPEIGSSGRTWSGPPFVEQIKRPTGVSGRDATLYALRFRQE